jgi:hypothetical protein
MFHTPKRDLIKKQVPLTLVVYWSIFVRMLLKHPENKVQSSSVYPHFACLDTLRGLQGHPPRLHIQTCVIHSELRNLLQFISKAASTYDPCTSISLN